MSYEFYKVLHISGLILLASGFVSLLTLKMLGTEVDKGVRKFAFITHGVGLTILLVSGFGLAARLGFIQGLPNWIFFKLFVWLCLGGAIALVKRQGANWGFKLYTILFLVMITAAYAAITKPF